MSSHVGINLVAGGWGSRGEDGDVVEVLLNDHWTTADSLDPCKFMAKKVDLVWFS